MTAIDRTDLQRVIAVINNKGGVGKTTLTANIGGILAASGWRVLLVDLDHQGNLGMDLGYEGTAQDDDGAGLSKAMLYPDDDPKPLKNVRPGLDVLPGGRYLESASATLSAYSSKGPAGTTEARLSVAKMLNKIAADYDIILMDCPPGNDVIQSAAVTAARYLLIPSIVDDGSLKGLSLTADRIESVADLNPDVDLLGVVQFGAPANAHKIRKEFVAEASGIIGGGADAAHLIFTNEVRYALATAKQARKQGLLVHELDAQGRNAPKWYELLKEGAPANVNSAPPSSTSVAGSLHAVTMELIERLAQFESEDVEVPAHV